MKNKKFLIMYFILLGISIFGMAKADSIPMRSKLPPFLFWISTSLFLELIFGYLLFFRKNKKGILAILVANIISYPLFFLYFTFSVWVTEGYNLSNLIFLPLVIIGEIFVILLEAIIIKFILKQEIIFKKSLLISSVLNIISLLGGLIVTSIFSTLYF